MTRRRLEFVVAACALFVAGCSSAGNSAHTTVTVAQTLPAGLSPQCRDALLVTTSTNATFDSCSIAELRVVAATPATSTLCNQGPSVCELQSATATSPPGVEDPVLFRIWSECVALGQDPVAAQTLCKEVAATDSAARYRTPSVKFPKIYQFEEEVLAASGAPSTFTPWADAPATSLPTVVVNDILAANNIGDYSALHLELTPENASLFVDVRNLHMLAPANPIKVVDGSSDGNLDLCVTIVNIDRFGRGEGSTSIFHYQVTLDANAITNLHIAGALAQPAVCAG